MIPEYIRGVIKFNEKHIRPIVPDEFFRKPDPTEEAQFRQWAVDNFDPGRPINPTWHPVVREEWRRLQGEYEGDGSV